MAAFVELTGIPNDFFARKGAEIIRQLHDESDVLGQLLQFAVSSRTPVDTGALLSDVSYVVGKGDVLVTVYSDDENQLDEWGRFYALYQEGGLLGLTTYTNAPHEMFARIMTDDIPDIEAWGQAAIGHVPWP